MNTQSPEKRSKHEPGSLDVHSMFATIQGEGPFVGQPAYFIRLAGCNLQCPGCDTEYTAGRQRWAVGAIVSHVRENFGASRLVVITGGEPFRQEITPLAEQLINAGIPVQIETNGSLPPSPYWEDSPLITGFLRDGRLSIVCSPKTGRVAARLYDAMWECQTAAFKYVLRDGDQRNPFGLPLQALDHPTELALYIPPLGDWKDRIYVQPMDERDATKNAANMNAAMESALRYGHIVGMQLHKIIGVP